MQGLTALTFGLISPGTPLWVGLGGIKIREGVYYYIYLYIYHLYVGGGSLIYKCLPIYAPRRQGQGGTQTYNSEGRRWKCM